MATIVDLTLALTETTPPFPGDPPLQITRIADYSKGDDYRLSQIALSAHLGTHLDAPAHFIENGKSIDELPLEALVGPAQILECLTASAVVPAHLENRIVKNCRRLLLKTTASPSVSSRPTAWLAPEAASLLVESGIELVGIDSPSIDNMASAEAPCHKILLGNDVFIVENLLLSSVSVTSGELICLPLRITGIEGSPVRAILRYESE